MKNIVLKAFLVLLACVAVGAASKSSIDKHYGDCDKYNNFDMKTLPTTSLPGTVTSDTPRYLPIRIIPEVVLNSNGSPTSITDTTIPPKSRSLNRSNENSEAGDGTNSSGTGQGNKYKYKLTGTSINTGTADPYNYTMDVRKKVLTDKTLHKNRFSEHIMDVFAIYATYCASETFSSDDLTWIKNRIKLLRSQTRVLCLTKLEKHLTNLCSLIPNEIHISKDSDDTIVKVHHNQPNKEMKESNNLWKSLPLLNNFPEACNAEKLEKSIKSAVDILDKYIVSTYNNEFSFSSRAEISIKAANAISLLSKVYSSKTFWDFENALLEKEKIFIESDFHIALINSSFNSKITDSISRMLLLIKARPNFESINKIIGALSTSIDSLILYKNSSQILSTPIMDNLSDLNITLNEIQTSEGRFYKARKNQRTDLDTLDCLYEYTTRMSGLVLSKLKLLNILTQKGETQIAPKMAQSIKESIEDVMNSSEKTLELCEKLCNKKKIKHEGAEKYVSEISSSVKNLSTLMDDIEDALAKSRIREKDAFATASLKETYAKCRTMLLDISKKCNSYINKLVKKNKTNSSKFNRSWTGFFHKKNKVMSSDEEELYLNKSASEGSKYLIRGKDYGRGGTI